MERDVGTMALNFLDAVQKMEDDKFSLFSSSKDSSRFRQQSSDTTGPHRFLGRLVRDRLAGLSRQQPRSLEEQVVKEVRNDLLFERKLDIILRNPDMFRRYQRYAVESKHFSPSGLGYMLLDFMDQDMKIPDLLEDIQRQGGQSRYEEAYVVSALDEYDTETITFDSLDGEDEEYPSPCPSRTRDSSLPFPGTTTSPTSVLNMPDVVHMSTSQIKSSSSPSSINRHAHQYDPNRWMSSESFSTGMSLPSLDGTEHQFDDHSVDSSVAPSVHL